MPCYDSRDSDFLAYRDGARERFERSERDQKYIDKLTRMLCKVCHELEDRMYLSLTDVNEEVGNWFEEHKRVDAVRAARKSIKKGR